MIPDSMTDGDRMSFEFADQLEKITKIDCDDFIEMNAVVANRSVKRAVRKPRMTYCVKYR